MMGSRPHSHRRQRWSDINRIVSQAKKKARLGDDSFSTPHAWIPWTAFGAIFEKDMRVYREAVRLCPSSDLQTLSTMLTWILKSFKGSLLNLTDRTHLVAPFLWAVVPLVPNTSVSVDENLDGSRVDAPSHFDFVLRRGTNRVGVLAVKGEMFRNSLLQALLGCEIFADIENCHEVHAIVTDGQKWVFIRSLDESILYDEVNLLTFCDDAPDTIVLHHLMGKLQSILLEE